MSKVTFQLEPLSCPSCIQKIETMLNRTDGVASSSVLFHAGKVKAVFDPERIDATQLRTQLEQLGYAVQSVRIGVGSR